VPLDRLDGFKLSWLIETSPGNHQGGIILAEPLTDGAAAVRLLNARKCHHDNRVLYFKVASGNFH
jgi:hypothetical protein